MKIGVMDSALKQPWEKLFDIAAKIGFEGVELGVHKNYEDTKLWNAQGRLELRQLSETYNTPIASICLHVYWQISFASSKEPIRKKAVDIARSSAAIASEIGAKNLLIPLTQPQEVPPEKARELWIQGIKSCVDSAEDHEVIYALENVNRPFAKTGEDLASIVDEINSPYVKVYYDPANAVHALLNPLKDIEILGKRISQVHIKDPPGKHLGEGRVDLPLILKALKDVGYDDWLILETPATENPLEAGIRNLCYLRGVLSGLRIC